MDFFYRAVEARKVPDGGSKRGQGEDMLRVKLRKGIGFARRLMWRLKPPPTNLRCAHGFFSLILIGYEDPPLQSKGWGTPEVLRQRRAKVDCRARRAVPLRKAKSKEGSLVGDEDAALVAPQSPRSG